MGFWGKIIGALIGLAILKLPGAILGVLLGHMFDVAYAKDFANRGGFGRFFAKVDAIKQDAIFFHALFSALGHISKADGRVTQEEILVATRLMDEMRLDGDLRKEAQQAFRDGKAKDFPLQNMLDEFKQHCHGRSDIMQIYLEILITASFADGQVSQAELNVLQRVAQTLGFSNKDLQFLITAYETAQRFRQAYTHRAQSGHQGQQRQSYSNNAVSVEDAYRVLGVSSSLSDKEIKRAYKKLMAQHHPDKLLSKGLPQQALDMAKQKTQDIQAAYELIKEKRGFN